MKSVLHAAVALLVEEELVLKIGNAARKRKITNPVSVKIVEVMVKVIQPQLPNQQQHLHPLPFGTPAPFPALMFPATKQGQTNFTR